jgi:hypothetical protein
MRHSRILPSLAGMLLLGVLGCKHPPELKPPERPEVLDMASDKRFDQQPRFPTSELNNDPLKTKQSDVMQAKGKGPGGGGMSMGGAPPGGGGGY